MVGIWSILRFPHQKSASKQPGVTACLKNLQPSNLQRNISEPWVLFSRNTSFSRWCIDIEYININNILSATIQQLSYHNYHSPLIDLTILPYYWFGSIPILVANCLLVVPLPGLMQSDATWAALITNGQDVINKTQTATMKLQLIHIHLRIYIYLYR